MIDTKKPRKVVSPPPKRFRWKEAPIRNEEGVVVKRPKEEDKELSEQEEVIEVEEEVEDDVVLEGVEDVKDIPEGQESKYGI